ncbi:Replication factor C subunit [Sesamum alatum]|uniref:Replication factor C subunit n=1 Tax=Sesamum alatum TaxID=300844 RepID=A0AAE1XMU5_9LAMI|nr:Replication factor C subunit [Sesamum alatum]
MPSPVIPRSKSAPDITSPHSPPNVQSSSKSVRSARSTGSSITSWTKKLGVYIAGKKKNPNLTEESLQEFNRRNTLIEARYNTSSPYYKGLTDFSLVINREKLSGSSPGRESHATSYISSGTKSSFIVMVQEWSSSCFSTSKKHEQSSYSSVSSWTKSSRFMTSSSSSSSSKTTEKVALTKIRTKTIQNDSEFERRKVTFLSMRTDEDAIIPSTMEKPLREKDSKPASMLPVPPPIASPLMLPLSPPTASPPESLPYPLPYVTLPTGQTLLTPPPVAAGGVIHANKATNTAEVQRKYVWADKYRPFWLQDFLCNRRTALWLQAIVRNWRDKGEECGHFIFEGNPGVGKRTMIGAFLKEAFGEDKVQGEAVGSILVNLKVSPQHVEVNLSELKGYEKHVIVELIKEKSQTSDNTLHCNEENCKAIVLYEADKLSTDALSYIKWMLEKFKGCNKVFFCCSDAKKLQEIKPLCTYVQLLEPSIEEILDVLAFIATQEGIQLPYELAYKIANNSKNNLRQAIRSFEATWHLNASLTEDQDIKTGWEDKIANIARNVLEEQSPKQLYNIRGELQNLIEHNVAPEFIFQTLKEELKKILPDQLQPQFDHLYEEYQKNRANKKHLSCAHQQEELGNRQNDQKRNVQQFMRIEASSPISFSKIYFLQSLENDTQCSTSVSSPGSMEYILPLMLDKNHCELRANSQADAGNNHLANCNALSRNNTCGRLQPFPNGIPIESRDLGPGNSAIPCRPDGGGAAA